MLNLSYTISPEISTTLNTIELHRRHILLQSVPPRTIRRLVWETMTHRLTWVQNRSDDHLTRQEVSELLQGKKKARHKEIVDLVWGFRNALTYLSEEWVGNGKTVTFKGIVELADILGGGAHKAEGLLIDERDAGQLLEYLQTQKDHPVVISGIIYSQWLLQGDFLYPNPLAILLMYLFLYKAGYDLRGLLNPEYTLLRNPREYEAGLTEIREKGTSNLWLSFFTRSVEKHFHSVRDRLINPPARTEMPTDFFSLTDRQREILSLLDEPGSMVTNKKVQKTFKVSQITASRDLAKLATLGLLLPRGQGRSVQYTRA